VVDNGVIATAAASGFQLGASSVSDTLRLYSDTTLTVNTVTFDPTGFMVSATPFYMAMEVGGAPLVAGTVYGGTVIPSTHDQFFKHATFRINAAGIGGSTNAVVRLTDGSIDCDFSFACNTSPNPIEVGSTGTCQFATGSLVDFTVFSIGDCATGPSIFGNINLEFIWQ
jgi:hypothetical protein